MQAGHFFFVEKDIKDYIDIPGSAFTQICGSQWHRGDITTESPDKSNNSDVVTVSDIPTLETSLTTTLI